MPDVSLEWKEWFTQLANGARPLLLDYHGVTTKMMLGQIPKAMLRIFDIAYKKLQEAGFGCYAPQAYSLIVNFVLCSISARNLRSPAERENRHDLRHMVENLQPYAASSPAFCEILTNYFVPLSDPQYEDDMSQEYFDLGLASMLAGIEITILPMALGRAK